jgi:hypothetical protein
MVLLNSRAVLAMVPPQSVSPSPGLFSPLEVGQTALQAQVMKVIVA